MSEEKVVMGILLPDFSDVKCVSGPDKHISIGIVAIDEAGKITNPGYGRHEMDKLRFTMYVDAARDQRFGFRLDYRDIYSVDLEDAERMVKMLRKVQRVNQKLPIRPATFGQFVQLMAKSLGITKAVQRVGDGPAMSSYRDNDYRVLDISNAQNLIDQLIDEVVEDWSKRNGTAAA